MSYKKYSYLLAYKINKYIITDLWFRAITMKTPSSPSKNLISCLFKKLKKNSHFKKKMGWFIFIFKKKYLLENYTLKFKKKISKSILFYLFNYELNNSLQKKSKKEINNYYFSNKISFEIKINMNNCWM